MTIYARPLVIPTWAETGDKVQPTNAELLAGWPVSSTPPSRQRFNFALNYSWNGIRYLTQRGISDWISTEEYPARGIVRSPNGLTYRAKVNNINLTPQTNPDTWERWGFSLEEFYNEQELLATLADPVFTGNPQGPTRPEGDASESFATTRFVMRAVNSAVLALFPVGVIVMWNGAVADIPAKFALCNGQNGTPDLRDKFVFGGGGVAPLNSTGGAQTVVLGVNHLPPHAHPLTINAVGDHAHNAWADTQGWHGHGMDVAGGHNHGIRQGASDTGAGDMVNADNQHNRSTWTEWAGDHSHGIQGSGNHSHNIGIGASGSHTHGGSIGNTGGGEAHNNMPPYMVKCFIMRVEA